MARERRSDRVPPSLAILTTLTTALATGCGDQGIEVPDGMDEIAVFAAAEGKTAVQQCVEKGHLTAEFCQAAQDFAKAEAVTSDETKVRPVFDTFAACRADFSKCASNSPSGEGWSPVADNDSFSVDLSAVPPEFKTDTPEALAAAAKTDNPPAATPPAEVKTPPCPPDAKDTDGQPPECSPTTVATNNQPATGSTQSHGGGGNVVFVNTGSYYGGSSSYDGSANSLREARAAAARNYFSKFGQSGSIVSFGCASCLCHAAGGI